MSSEDRDDVRHPGPGPGPDDGAWVAELARRWAPPPLDAAGAARFDAALRERLEARRRPGLLPALGTATLAAAALALAVWLGTGPAPESGVAGERAALVAWEWELLAGEAPAGDAFSDETLPEEWQAMAQVFLGP